MARVERGNVVLNVKDYEVERYLTLGYNITDESGNIIQQSIPTSVGELQKAFVENKTVIENLNAQISKLTGELEALKKKSKNASKE